MKRRSFLIGAGVVTGGLAVGYRLRLDGFETAARALVTGPGESLLAGWIKIAADDTVTIYSPSADVGQGSQTALAMMAAEEMDADWSKVRVAQAPADPAFADWRLAEGWTLKGRSFPSPLQGAVDIVFKEAARAMDLQLTGGSAGVRATGQYGLRVVGATVRAMLIEAAARRWSVPAAELIASEGIVRHPASGRFVRYGTLAPEAAILPVPAPARFKSAKEFRIIGRSPPRSDIPDKVTGAQRYAIDVVLPGLLHAAARSAPVHGGRLLSAQDAAALAVPGVEAVVPLEDSVVVIGRGYWQAQRGLAALAPVFSDGGNGEVTTASIYARHERAVRSGDETVRVAIGDTTAVYAATPADRRIGADYRVPFLHHAGLEPISAAAQLAEGRLTVWAGEREPLAARAALARLAGLDLASVTLNPMAVGGSFGRRSARASDSERYLAQLVAAAKRVAPRPVKLIWSREEDFAQNAFRPQLATRLRGTIGPDGRPTAWIQTYVDGAKSRVDSFEIPYLIANQTIRSVASPVHVRTGSWRSVNSSQHGFWTESFIDELAHATGLDPLAYRLGLLPSGSREMRVLEKVADLSGWGGPLPPGAGRGVALVPCFGSVVAEVVEASLGRDGRPRIHRVVAAVDCGLLVHADTGAQQIEGAIVMGLSAAVGEQITIAGGAVEQRNFTDYPLMSLAECPRIEVHFLPSDAPPGGLGEAGLPAAAPALGNALFAATGQRFRTLPFLTAAT